jgi:hypothetical protein
MFKHSILGVYFTQKMIELVNLFCVFLSSILSVLFFEHGFTDCNISTKYQQSQKRIN